MSNKCYDTECLHQNRDLNTCDIIERYKYYDNTSWPIAHPHCLKEAKH